MPSEIKHITVDVLVRNELGKLRMRPLQGESVAPGLAITPAYRFGQRIDQHFALVHTPSGRYLSGRVCCRGCVEDAAKRAVDSGVDWSRSEAEVRADETAKALHQALLMAGLTESCDEECA